jgi:hypothetical protein
MNHLDEHGVPTLRASIPISLFGFGMLLNLAGMIPLILDQVRTALGGAWVERDTAARADRVGAGVGAALTAALFVAFAVTAVYYFRRRRAARALVIATLAAAIVINLIELIVLLKLGPQNSNYVAKVVGPTAPVILVCTLWLLYFGVSKQVRRTFVYPLHGSEATRAIEGTRASSLE